MQSLRTLGTCTSPCLSFKWRTLGILINAKLGKGPRESLDNDLNLKNKIKQANKRENNIINQEMHKERNPTKKMQTKRNKE